MPQPNGKGKAGRKNEMKELFHDLMKTDGIRGVAVLSLKGELLFEHARDSAFAGVRTGNWRPFAAALADVREADLVFQTLRVYIRRAEIGHVIVFLEVSAQPAMIRLNCDLLLPGLRRQPARKGLMRFFRSGK